MKPPLEFYEKVRVIATRKEAAKVFGELGAVVGRVESETSDEWYYTVSIYSTEECWCFFESEITPIGEMDDPNNFQSGEFIRVRLSEEGDGLETDEDATKH